MSDGKCPVCDCLCERSFNHYGGQNVCSSCRNFFRRSVLNGQWPTFSCRLVLNDVGAIAGCVVDSKTRKSCKKCRFDRCLGAGMKINWVNNEKKENDSTVKKEDSPKRSSEHEVCLVKSVVLDLTLEEQNFLQALNKSFVDTTNKFYYSIFSDHPNILLEWIHLSREGMVSPAPYDWIKNIECIDYFMLTETSFKFLDLAGLSTGEQSGLVQTNINKMLSFIWALFVQANDMKYFTQSFTDYGLQNIGCQTVQNVLPILQQADLPDGTLLFNYQSIYASPWASSEDIENEHLKVSQAISRWCRPSKPEAHVDYLLLVLVLNILIMSSDESNLTPDQKSRIEQVQLQYTCLLQRYLKFSYKSQANSKFGDALMMIHTANELHKMHSMRLPF